MANVAGDLQHGQGAIIRRAYLALSNLPLGGSTTLFQ